MTADGGTPMDASISGDLSILPDASSTDGGERYRTAARLGTVGAGLDEVSGIVASRTYPGFFWVHNDSGDTPRFFALDSTAATVATINVSDATSEDWEDITITEGEGGGDVIYLANTGDNRARDTNGADGRAFVELYRVEEPDPTAGNATVESERFRFVYPERPYDCEAVFVDHATGGIYFVTKEDTPAEVFVARPPLSTTAMNLLEHAGSVDFSIATAADESRDGTRIAVRGYISISVYLRAAGETPIETLMRNEPLGVAPASAAEAVCFEPTGYSLYTIAEGNDSPLYRIPWN